MLGQTRLYLPEGIMARCLLCGISNRPLPAHFKPAANPFVFKQCMRLHPGRRTPILSRIRANKHGARNTVMDLSMRISLSARFGFGAILFSACMGSNRDYDHQARGLKPSRKTPPFLTTKRSAQCAPWRSGCLDAIRGIVIEESRGLTIARSSMLDL
jgi:hypothetical protein